MTSFRPLGARDAEVAYPILAEALTSMWTLDALRGELGHATSLGLGLEESGALVGVSVSRQVVGDEGEILLVAVVPSARRRGLGAALVARTLETLAARGVRRAFLLVRASNGPARALYARAGFRELRASPRAYRDPTEDGIELGLDLAS